MSFFNLSRSMTFLSAGRRARVSYAVTDSPGFQTILVHTVPTDGREQMTFDLFCEKLLDGFEFAAFQLESTVICPGGILGVLGTTEVFSHKSGGAASISARVVGDGFGGCLLQVSAPVGEWNWRIEAVYKKLDI